MVTTDLILSPMIRSSSIFIRIIFLMLFCGIVSPVIAQPPPPPTQHGLGENQPSGGAGAPIGDGMFLLLAFGAAYSVRKVYNARRKEDES